MSSFRASGRTRANWEVPTSLMPDLSNGLLVWWQTEVVINGFKAQGGTLLSVPSVNKLSKRWSEQMGWLNIKGFCLLMKKANPEDWSWLCLTFSVLLTPLLFYKVKDIRMVVKCLISWWTLNEIMCQDWKVGQIRKEVYQNQKKKWETQKQTRGGHWHI